MLLLVVAGFATTVAEPPPAPDAPPIVRIDEPEEARIDDFSILQRVGKDHVRVSLTFSVHTSRTNAIDLEMPIDIPRDAAIVGLKLAIGEAKPNLARLSYAVEARKTYEKIIAVERDPALLEYSHSTPTHHRLQLHVFPVTVGNSATVTIELITNRTIAMQLEKALVVENHVIKTDEARPLLGFGRQVGPKMSLLATDRAPGTPEGVRITALNNAF